MENILSNHKIWRALAMFMVTVSCISLPFVSSAQESQILQGTGGGTSTQDVITDTTGLGTENPEDITISLVNVVLGFLSLVAVVIIMYGGFTWMTAAGNEDKIKTAQDILKAAVIGLIIILASWALTNYLINTAIDSTGGTKVPYQGALEKFISYNK